MKFNKKIETFGMFGLTFEIRKNKETKCRYIFCQNVMIVNIDNIGYIKDTLNGNKLEIMNQFQEMCAKNKFGKKEILEYISKKKV